MSDQAQLGLSADDLRIVTEILASHVPDRPVYAFGSRATSRARRRSDLDLAIGGMEPLSFRQRGLMNLDFDESDLPIKVDVVDLNAIAPEFRRRIERDFIPIQAASGKAEAMTA